jgi:hypothetical protein
MNPTRFTELLIVGLNLTLLLTFLAWRFVGPGRPEYPKREFDTVTNKDIPTGK